MGKKSINCKLYILQCLVFPSENFRMQIFEEKEMLRGVIQDKQDFICESSNLELV